MVTILNPSYESGFSTNWSFSSSGVNQSIGNSATGATDGTNACFVRQLADAGRNVGDYIYSTQTITIDNDFTLFFDWYSGGNDKYSLIVLIDSTEELVIELSSSGQNTDESVEITGYSGSHTLKVGVKCTASTTTGETIYLDNFRVGEIAQDCQSTGAIYAGSQYDSSYVNASIYLVEISPSGAHNQLCNITTPWGDVHNSEVLEYEVLETYSRSVTGGTEYYTLYCTFVVYSETAYAIYTECWYTDLGKRYVKTTGSDSALGTTWGVAWKTAGYGFQNIPSGKDLYVEQGLYGDETLSNLNPPQTMKMYIQPSGHTEAVCKVVISDDSVINEFTAGNTVNTDFTGLTIISLTNTYSNTFYVYKVRLQGATGGFNGSFKLKTFTSDATTFYYVDESELMSAVVAAGSYIDVYLPTALKVNSGEHLSVYGASGAVNCRFVSGGTTYWKSGDIVTNTLKSAMNTFGVSHGFQISGF